MKTGILVCLNCGIKPQRKGMLTCCHRCSKEYSKQCRKQYRKTDKYKQYKKQYQKTDKYKKYQKQYHQRKKKENKANDTFR